MEMPGLDTVHCWSRVRSRVDCRHITYYCSIMFLPHRNEILRSRQLEQRRHCRSSTPAGLQGCHCHTPPQWLPGIPSLFQAVVWNRDTSILRRHPPFPFSLFQQAWADAHNYAQMSKLAGQPKFWVGIPQNWTLEKSFLREKPSGFCERKKSVPMMEYWKAIYDSLLCEISSGNGWKE